MDNYELENTNTEIDKTEDGVDSGLIALIIAGAGAVAGLGTSLYFGMKSHFLKKKLREEQEKKADFQKVIREHQAEIDILTSEKERQEYLIRLYEEYISKLEK